MHTWRKTAFINTKEIVKDIICIGNIAVIWTKTSILGYDTLSNSVIWKIQIENFPEVTPEKKLTVFDGKAVFCVSPMAHCDEVFVVDPQKGNIEWTLSEKAFREYSLMNSNTSSHLLPLFNTRKENSIMNHYIVMMDMVNCKKTAEVKLPSKAYTGYMSDEYLYIYDISNKLRRINPEAPEKGLEDVCIGQVDSFYQKNGITYYLLKDKDENFSITMDNSKSKENSSIPWPEKRSQPYIKWKIRKDYVNDENSLLISWATKTDDKTNPFERKVGLFDVDQKVFKWLGSFGCNENIIPTPYGVFLGSLFINYQDGTPMNSGVNLSFIHPQAAFYEGDSLYYYNGEILEIYKWLDNAVTVQKANMSTAKVFNFNDRPKSLY